MKAGRILKKRTMSDNQRIRENCWSWQRALFRIIPILGLVCMFFSGCDATDEQTFPPRTVLTSENPATRTSHDPPPKKHSPIQTSRPSSDERPRIVAFGDSLTAGLGVSPEESYPSRLQRRLDEAGYQYRVINAGVSGDTTAGALRRLNWVLKNKPSIVIIELGANDGLRGQPVSHMYQNLREILQRLQEARISVLLTGMKIPPNYGKEYTSQFADIYRQLADEFHVAFMPFFLDGVAAHRALNQADGIHPTSEGYEVIVENLFPLLEPLLTVGKQSKNYHEFNEVPYAPS